MIAPTKEPKLEDTTLEPKEETSPSATRTVPTLASYTNLQKWKIKAFLEQQSVIILIDAGSTHNFRSSKVAAHLMLQKEDYNGFGRCCGSSLGHCRRNREARWEHIGRSSKEDRKTHRKNTGGCRIGGSRLAIEGVKGKDNSAQVYPPDIPINEEAQVQLMIAWDRRIMTHHCPYTTADAGWEEHGVPSTGTMRSPMRSCISRPGDVELSLEYNADLTRASLLGT
ncbi:hypothetical protein GW17_00041246 [Ensete ventricosum]|nr:hypothetical protein GW17_00041246 [Ensete ventricosum]RZR96053.1 hypothetical protein BHM03_00025026 [Ensete ventricosum]